MQGWQSLLPFVLIIAVFWLLVLRPARKRQHEVAATQRSIATGAHVMLASGIFGTVTSLADDTVALEIAPGTTVKVARQAVARVIEDSSTPREPVEPPPGPDTGTPSGPDGGSDKR